ncbi:MAG: hypothetical protein V4582_19365 [Pseudomonadota bacterium]
MNLHASFDDGGLAIASEADHVRLDGHQSDIIDHAIWVQEASSTVAAVEYLKSHNVAPAIIERVLLEPERRRHLPQH